MDTSEAEALRRSLALTYCLITNAGDRTFCEAQVDTYRWAAEYILMAIEKEGYEVNQKGQSALLTAFVRAYDECAEDECWDYSYVEEIEMGKARRALADAGYDCLASE